MSQTIALSSTFQPVDMPGMVQASQQARLRDIQLQNAPLEAEVQRMGLEDQRGRLSALSDYRTRAAAGNQVDGLSALNAYPDEQANIYKQIDDAFGGMSYEEMQKAFRRADALARGAQYIRSYPMGSPQQKKAWTSTLDVLLNDGFIDDETHKLWLQTGPTEEALDAAISAREHLEGMVDPKTGEINARTRLTEAKIDDIGVDNERADSEAANRNANRDSRTGALNAATGKPGAGGQPGTGKGGLTEYQRWQVLKDIDARLELKREEGMSEPEIAALETYLLQQAGLARTAEELDRYSGGPEPVSQGNAPAAAPNRGPVSADAPPGTEETRVHNGKTYYKIDGQWMVAE